jgi:proteasome-associated ATPase
VLDVKIKIERPDAEGAHDIFSEYITETPAHPRQRRRRVRRKACVDGMIQNIVDRAKKSAIKSVLESGQTDLWVQHLLDAVVDEFAENEDLSNTTNPDDWARIIGDAPGGNTPTGPVVMYVARTN